MDHKIRVRFAPSPTGPLHIGGLRIAIYNYLFARKHGGDFILQIDDTDRARIVEGAEVNIIEALKFCGIDYDEEVRCGNSIQHKCFKLAEKLVANGHAYYAFDKPEELDALRKEYEAADKTFVYNHELRENLRTSLRLTPAEVEGLKTTTTDWVIRLKVPTNQILHVSDLTHGQGFVNSNTLDDRVIWRRSDEMASYHLSSIVLDHDLGITHVIRGEEWLPSLPIHILLYSAFDWGSTLPQFAHIPNILKPDGKGKLSIQDGDRLGFPVLAIEWTSQDGQVSRGYREDGYSPEALVSMLALLGFNSPPKDKVLSMRELIDLFDIRRISKSNPRFNHEQMKRQ